MRWQTESDYISKSALIEILEKSMKENSHKSMIGYAEHIQEHRHLIHLVEKQPTVDEKEIIRKPMERILTRLEEEVILERMNKMEDRVGKRQTTGFCLGVNASIEIVKEEGGIE